VPEHVSVKLAVAVSAPVDWLPLVAFVPDQSPDALHTVASVELQVSVAEPPLAVVVGFAVSVTVGGATTVTVAVWLALPPTPEHVRV
jgi:hypothetical protein